jgi:hypothetical protein
MSSGYNMECDAGSLYYRKCYIIGADGSRNEIIGWQDSGPNGNPAAVTKSPTTAAGAAWQPQIFALNQDGSQYQPYAGGGIPMGYLNFMPATSTDPQDLYYMNYKLPGAMAWRKQQTYTAKWWMPTFGLRKSGITAEEMAEIQQSGTMTPEQYESRIQREKVALVGLTSILTIGLFTGLNKYLKK